MSCLGHLFKKNKIYSSILSYVYLQLVCVSRVHISDRLEIAPLEQFF